MIRKLIGRIKILVRQIDSYSPWPIFFPWVMSKDEKEIFDSTIKDSREYLEFGSGGSTIRALQKSRANIQSIDSSTEWFKAMRKYLFIRRNEGKRLNFFYVNIGPTKEWGFPIDDSSKDLFPSYSSKIFEEVTVSKLDTILVDGRFRVASALYTILKLKEHGNEKDKILIHDFWNRPHYHQVLNYLEVFKRVDTLGVFKIKKGLNIEALKKDYKRFMYDPR